MTVEVLTRPSKPAKKIINVIQTSPSKGKRRLFTAKVQGQSYLP